MSIPSALSTSRTGPVARFDNAVDHWWQSHLRGRRPLDLVFYGASAAGEHSAIWLLLGTAVGWRKTQRAATASCRLPPAHSAPEAIQSDEPADRSPGITDQGAHPQSLTAAGQALGRSLMLFATESLLVNGLVKSLFRRERPVSGEPRPLPLRIPRTTSFPSGHASSAFFAAALLRDSLGWSACYLLATTIAASRVHVRIHHASDVIAGAAVGAILGELTRHAFPLVRPGHDVPQGTMQGQPGL